MKSPRPVFSALLALAVVIFAPAFRAAEPPKKFEANWASLDAAPP